MNVGLTSPRFERYALLYPASTSLQKELCNYYCVVINLCTRVVLFVMKSVVKQIASALRKPFDDEFGTFQRDLTRLGTAVKEEISLAAKQQQNLDSIEGARERKETSLFRATGTVFRRETAIELGQAKKWREGRVKSRFLNSCSTYNFETTLNQARKKGASAWIFKYEEYQQWKSRCFPSTLLCSGIVGSGKTVLCANVVEDLILNRPLDSSLGYFFCRSDEAASLRAREVVGSLARQLLEDVPTDTFKFDQINPSIGDVTLNTDQVLSNMLLLLPQHKHYIMVLDGLDECEYEEVRVLIESVQSLLKSSKHVFKLFWTGRPDFVSRVSEQFRSDFQIHISRSNNGPEISRFIELALEDSLESGRLKLRDPKIVLKIQDALEAGACEMFLWVAFQIDSICAQNTDHDILNSLEHLPKGLPATFRRILGRLQHSAFTDPSLGRKIFEIVAAAQRPLTVNELEEAISITPGDTEWNQSKLVNNILKSLESCGSFIVVDEELSTVHFAHSSIKRHLLSKATKLDIRDYHIDSSRADINLGSIVVTYLSLDVLDHQLTKASGPSQPYAANVPSFVVKSTLLKHDVVNKMALAILRGRRTPVKDSGLDLERSAHLLREDTHMQEVFSFLPYCQEYWLYHSRSIYASEHDRVYELWTRLLNGTERTAELPWASEKPADLGEQFLGWITKNVHIALIIIAIRQLWSNRSYNIAKFGAYSSQAFDGSTSRFFDMGRLELLLSLLPDEEARRSLDLDSPTGIDALLQEAVTSGYEAVVRLVIQNGVVPNINILSDLDGKANLNDLYGKALHDAVWSNQKAIAELLIDSGANVNYQGEKYGSALEAAAALHGMDPIVKLLLEKGADMNACGGGRGTALTAAAAIDNVAAIELLLKAGADVNVYAGFHGTALIAAVTNENSWAVMMLLKAGAKVDSRGPNGARPLRVAAKRENEFIVKQLLACGAPIKETLEDEQEYMKYYETSRAIARMLRGASLARKGTHVEFI